MDILINSLPALLAVIVTFLLTQYSNFAKQRIPNEFLLFYELIEKANAASVSTYPGTQPLKKEIIDKANFLLQSLK